MPESQLRLFDDDAPSNDDSLTPDQRRDLASIVALGCDQQTAAAFLGVAAAVLREQLQRSAARCEVHHMRCVHEATAEPKNYRAAIWWLERMRPEIYNRGEPTKITETDLNRFVEIIAAEIKDKTLRQRVFERMAQ